MKTAKKKFPNFFIQNLQIWLKSNIPIFKNFNLHHLVKIIRKSVSVMKIYKILTKMKNSYKQKYKNIIYKSKITHWSTIFDTNGYLPKDSLQIIQII